MSNAPVIKLWDIETSHNLLLAFDLLNRNMIPYKQILQERYIISGAFKDLDTGKVRGYGIHEYDLWDKDKHDDWAVVKAIHDELSSADAIVAHYGDKFDLPFFNGRAMFHGLPPISPHLIQIDTYKIAKNKLKLNSNRLDYLATFLGLGGKIPTNLDLWLDVFAGKEDAAEYMLNYNKQDVLLLEQVFKKVRPLIKTKINYTLFSGQEVACPHCGSENLHMRGFYYTSAGKYPKFQCQDCGGWGSIRKASKTRSKVK